MDVKLEVWKTGPYIIAPDYCPYKKQEKDVQMELTENALNGGGYYFNDIDTGIYTVHSSICSLCKRCNFTSTTLKPEMDIKTEEFVKYLTLINTKVSVSINNQNYFLRQKDRIPLVILISPEIFDSMLNLIYRDNNELLNQVKSYFINTESPFCYILGCPVYFSRKLTKSNVMIIGEIEWK
jgi:hypothetical protein